MTLRSESPLLRDLNFNCALERAKKERMDRTDARKSMTDEWTSQKCVKRLPPHLDKKLGELVKEIEGVR